MQALRKKKHPLDLHLLGKFRIQCGSRLIRLPTRKLESLLAFLVLHPESHSRDKLTTLFWGDVAENQARNSLRNALATLRAAMGSDLILADRQSVQLNPDASIWVDAREFEKVASDISQVESEVESQTGFAPLVTRHLQLYSGDLLVDLYDDWIAPERERLHALYIDALLRLTQTMRSRSEYGRAVEFAQQVLVRDGANERAHQHLIFCYLAMGNRTAALRQYKECQRALKVELGVEPSSETTALYEWIQQAPSMVRSDAARITNLLIPASSFIGRAQEIAEVKRLLDADRLVTCTGIGGCGKTRLALQVATDLIDAFRDGVWWIELGPLADERLMPQAIAKALGIWERSDQSLTETLCHVMRERKLLLVMDNCEHLIAMCAQVTETLLRACPELRILVTSRHSLGVSGESVFQVPPLSYPESDNDASLPMAYESVRLFTERARALKSDFQVTGANVRAVARICRQLDGIPLAIELAAARAQALTAEEIAANLDDLFNLLTLGNRTAIPRQQTLRASMDWSYRLLTDEEKRLFNRLAVFVGGFTLPAAQEIAGGIDRAEILDLLTRLVQKSLVIAEPSEGVTRYHYQETVRLYAREKLDESGEAESVCERHANYFAAFVEEGSEKLRGSEQAEWFNLLETEYPNVRAALSWAHQRRQLDTSLRVTGALSLFWFLRGYWTEGFNWVKDALIDAGWKIDENIVQPPSQVQPSHAHARALRIAGQSYSLSGDHARAQQLLTHCVAMWRAVGDPIGLSRGMNASGEAAQVRHDYANARELFKASLEISRSANYEHGICLALDNLAYAHLEQGNAAQARAFAIEALERWQKRNDRRGVSDVLLNLARIEYLEGEYDQARAAFERALSLQRELGLKSKIIDSLFGLGQIARARRDPAKARDLIQQSLVLWRELDHRDGMARCIGALGSLALGERDLVQARAKFIESIDLFRQVNNSVGIALSLIGFAGIAVEQTEWERAARLLGAAQVLLDQSGYKLAAMDRADLEQNSASARTALGDDLFAQRWKEGQEMIIEDAINLALSRESSRTGVNHGS